MEKTAEALCANRTRIEGDEFCVLNVGFGLGIVGSRYLLEELHLTPSLDSMRTD